MPASTFEQFIRFSTDAYGLERLLRLIQSVVQLSSALIFPLISFNLMKRLQSQLGLTRRAIRLFRFLDAFNSAYKLYASKSSFVSIVSWMDIMAHSFNGMYLLLETVTIVDALEIPGLEIWHPEYTKVLKVEAQRCWFMALVAGALASALRLYELHVKKQRVLASWKRSSLGSGSKSTETSERKHNGPAAPKADTEKQKALGNFNDKMLTLGRKFLANMLDLAIPGSAVGFISLDSGTVGLAMFITSLLTGYEVWKKCGAIV